LALLTHDGCQSFFDDSGATVVQIVHVRNGTPQAGPKVVVPGQLLESRLVGDVLYLVTDAWILVPQRIEAGIVVAGSWHREARIASIQLARPNVPHLGASVVVAGTANAVHATDRRLYVAMSELNAAELRPPTPGMHGIKVFNISDASGAVRSAGCIPTAGRVADKFKLHENGDLLSVVSLEDNSFRSTLETWSLARPREPRALARLPIVTGENLFATRFDGSRLYVVTFRRVDPLWIIDLADPAHPSIRGELQVPGWSTYLHPMGDRLLAMGLETGRPTISLFDVAEASAPRLVSKVALVDRWGSSEANETEKAFTVLADQGLVAALEAQARKASVPTEVRSDGIGRYPQDIEAAVYFCVLEALNNVAKYAEATRAEVSLAQDDGHLTFAVVDDGAGFDTAETSYGTGVQGMADRLDAIGGALQVVSRKGAGTTVEGQIPTPASSD
jgi:hypothetical protein